MLVRLHGEPLGYVEVPFAEAMRVEALVATAVRTFSTRIHEHLAAEGLTGWVGTSRPPTATPGCPNDPQATMTVSIIVCTRNRSAILGPCLTRLSEVDYPGLEVLIVDNAPSDDSTHRMVEELASRDPRFRYVVEPRPGLSRARNAGLAEARGEIVAYTDDDVAVDARWVQGIVKGFQRRRDVGCVTGLVCSASIESRAEQYFDARVAAWSSRCEPEQFDLVHNRAESPLYPYTPGSFGTGANFAFDRRFLENLGGFDTALGAGSRTRGGEDVDIFVRTLRAGRAIVYEPAALVWHHHRSSDEALLDQMYGYGTGLSAFATKCLLDPGTRVEVLRRLPGAARRMLALGRAANNGSGREGSRPRGALRTELSGIVVGPLLYLRARWESAR